MPLSVYLCTQVAGVTWFGFHFWQYGVDFATVIRYWSKDTLLEDLFGIAPLGAFVKLRKDFIRFVVYIRLSVSIKKSASAERIFV